MISEHSQVGPQRSRVRRTQVLRTCPEEALHTPAPARSLLSPPRRPVQQEQVLKGLPGGLTHQWSSGHHHLGRRRAGRPTHPETLVRTFRHTAAPPLPSLQREPLPQALPNLSPPHQVLEVAAGVSTSPCRLPGNPPGHLQPPALRLPPAARGSDPVPRVSLGKGPRGHSARTLPARRPGGSPSHLGEGKGTEPHPGAYS